MVTLDKEKFVKLPADEDINKIIPNPPWSELPLNSALKNVPAIIRNEEKNCKGYDEAIYLEFIKAIVSFFFSSLSFSLSRQ